jgi:hypothetical protein
VPDPTVGVSGTPRNWKTQRFLTAGFGPAQTQGMSSAQQAAPSLVDTLDAYIDDLSPEARPNALHQVFYGFATRLAIIDRATQELATHGVEDAKTFATLPGALGEALSDNALFVGQELFTSRVRTMSAMGYVSRRLREALDADQPAPVFTVTHAVAYDAQAGRLRSYSLARTGEHPDLPYDARDYNPQAS